MHEKHLYEYAIIRVFPRVESDEFINVGLLLFCKRQKYLRAEIKLDQNRFRTYPTELDLDQLKINLNSFLRIAQAEKRSWTNSLIRGVREISMA